MRKCLIILSIPLLLFASCHSRKEAYRLEQQAEAFHQANQEAKALDLYRKRIMRYPGVPGYGENLFKMAGIYESLDRIDTAMFWYGKILETNFRDNRKTQGAPHTHTNIKHRSCQQLGGIHFKAARYEKALYYYHAALHSYPYRSDSKYVLKNNNTLLRNWMADCYQNLGSLNTMMETLLPDAITESPLEVNYTAERLARFVSENYDGKRFRIDLEKGLENMEEHRDGYTLRIFVRDVFIPKEGYAIHPEPFLEHLGEGQ